MGRFKKRRELVWVEAGDLLAICEKAPDKLWKRVQQLENAPRLFSPYYGAKSPDRRQVLPETAPA